jgi:hypothetical protein
LNVPVGTLGKVVDFALSYSSSTNPYLAIGSEAVGGKQRLALGLTMAIDFRPKCSEVKGLVEFS